MAFSFEDWSDREVAIRVAPADAPITLYGWLIGDCFAEPIGDAK